MRYLRAAIICWGVAAALLVATVAWAGSYTFTTTAAQDTVLTRVLAKVNSDRALQGQTPYADVQAMLRGFLVDWAQGWLAQQRAEDVSSACDKYATLSAAAQTNIRTALGGKDPCP